MPHAESTDATRRDHDAADLELARHVGDVQARRAAEETSVKRRGSTPRRTDTSLMPSAMLVLTTR